MKGRRTNSRHSTRLSTERSYHFYAFLVVEEERRHGLERSHSLRRRSSTCERDAGADLRASTTLLAQSAIARK